MADVRSLVSLLSPDRVRLQMPADTKDDVLDGVVALVASHPAVADAEQLRADVGAREARMSTGVGDGLGLPHARTSAVTESFAALATFDPPVPYEALDGEPVHLVLFLAGPEGDRVEHLHILGRVSRVLSDSVVRERIAEARAPGDVIEALRAAEATIA